MSQFNVRLGNVMAGEWYFMKLLTFHRCFFVRRRKRIFTQRPSRLPRSGQKPALHGESVWCAHFSTRALWLLSFNFFRETHTSRFSVCAMYHSGPMCMTLTAQNIFWGEFSVDMQIWSHFGENAWIRGYSPFQPNASPPTGYFLFSPRVTSLVMYK